MKRLLLWSLFAIFAGIGCGSGSTSTPQPPANISVTVSPSSATVGAGQMTAFTAKVTGDASGVLWSVNGVPGGNSTVGTIDLSGNFTAPSVTQNSSATITATSKADSTKTANAAATIIAPGVVAPTANLQVAMYTITPPAGATVSVQFGLDTTYGLNTWSLPAPSSGGPVSILVAGMKMSSTYHLRAVLNLSDGSSFDDADHTFTTGTLPAASLPTIAVTATPGSSPQSGVELLDLLGLNTPPAWVRLSPIPAATCCGVTTRYCLETH